MRFIGNEKRAPRGSERLSCNFCRTVVGSDPVGKVDRMGDFSRARIKSQFDVLVRFIGKSEDMTEWKWDENLCQFVRRLDAE